MNGFDEEWKAGKVLVCSIARTNVRVWAWLSGAGDVVGEATQHALYITRETGHPTWVESYGAPACLPEQPRRSGNGFKE